MGIATTFQAGRYATAAQLNLKPYVHAYQGSAQTLTTGTWTEITMGSEALDTNTFHSTVSNTARCTPTVAGWYRCFGMVAFAGDTTGDRLAQFRKNATQVIELPYGPASSLKGSGLGGGGAFAGGTVQMNGTSDYISLYGIHNKGSNLDTLVTAGIFTSYWIIEWVAP